MRIGLRFYRDGSIFRFAVARIETMFLPELARMPGYRGCRILRYTHPQLGAGGVGIVCFDTSEHLDAANQAAAAWAEHHLRDLRAELTTSEQFEAKMLLADGPLL